MSFGEANGKSFLYFFSVVDFLFCWFFLFSLPLSLSVFLVFSFPPFVLNSNLNSICFPVLSTNDGTAADRDEELYWKCLTINCCVVFAVVALNDAKSSKQCIILWTAINQWWRAHLWISTFSKSSSMQSIHDECVNRVRLSLVYWMMLPPSTTRCVSGWVPDQPHSGSINNGKLKITLRHK